MFQVGDIVSIFAPTVGYEKYHLCVEAGSASAAFKFLFLNSDPNFAGVYSVECARVPCIPPSQTGKTAFSFNMVPRYNLNQLKIFKARKIGELDPTLAAELLSFAKTAIGLNRNERDVVCAALKLQSERKLIP